MARTKPERESAVSESAERLKNARRELAEAQAAARAEGVVLCESCGGADVQIIEFQGKRYFQCISEVPHKTEPGKTMACKFWSTKWRAD